MITIFCIACFVWGMATYMLSIWAFGSKQPLFEEYYDGDLTTKRFLGGLWETRNSEGELHAEGEPAVILPNGTRVYYQNNKKHRTDGPAVFDKDGKKEYWYKGHLIPVRDYNPSPLMSWTGVKIKGKKLNLLYNEKGQLHKDNGPAVIIFSDMPDGSWAQTDNEYYVDGKLIDKKDHQKRWQLIVRARIS